MKKRYAFKTKKKMNELIALIALTNEEGDIYYKSELSVLRKMDDFWCVNIVWHEPILEQFEEFEVNPKEPKVKWL